VGTLIWHPRVHRKINIKMFDIRRKEARFMTISNRFLNFFWKSESKVLIVVKNVCSQNLKNHYL